MIRASDFNFLGIDKSNGHEDYWFSVSGDTAKELTAKYMEQSMIEVTNCVYSSDEDIIGVQRQFPFNKDVIIPNDDDLKNVLRELSKQILKG